MSLTSGLDALRASLEEVTLSTGIGGLDELLGGGIRLGVLHLLYGSPGSLVDEVLHRILVKSLLPQERGGLGGRAIYISCGNYREERAILRVNLLTRLMEGFGLDPREALKRIYVLCAFSPEQQEEAFERARSLAEADKTVRLIAVHNIAKLFPPKPGGGPHISDGRPRLQRLVFDLGRTSAERALALVATCRPKGSAEGGLPKPEGGRYLSHTSGVIIYFRGLERVVISAHLIKHPSRAPRRIDFRMDGGDPMGRITHSFRAQFQEELRRLEASFAKSLRDEGRREAFNRIVEAWGSEMGAMSNADVPNILNIMILTALLDNRKRVEELYRDLEQLRSHMASLIMPGSKNGEDGRRGAQPGMDP